MIKHIKNRHADVLAETYERESTKQWLEEHTHSKFKKDMKQNYYADENKLFNQPGRKYHNSETSYYVSGGQSRDFN